jgi:hypothetical protein
MAIRKSQVVIIITSVLIWAVVLSTLLIAVTTPDLDLAKSMGMASRPLIEALIIWYALVAINSKGAYRFAVGFSISLALILALKHAFHLDAPDQLAKCIRGMLPKDAVSAEQAISFKVIRSNAIYHLSILLCSALGAIVTWLMGGLSSPNTSHRSHHRRSG